jgi:hypothetical protein
MISKWFNEVKFFSLAQRLVGAKYCSAASIIGWETAHLALLRSASSKVALALEIAVLPFQFSHVHSLRYDAEAFQPRPRSHWR